MSAFGVPTEVAPVTFWTSILHTRPATYFPVLRFPNPGSDLDSFIRIFHELFDALSERATLDLDDMTQVLIERNLATSSGFMGREALARSYRDDRSRDPLYNQSKMYSELFKALGWLHPTSESALRFKFTYLGAHAAAARRDPTALMAESLLGIVFPNEVLDTRGTQNIRPFATILRTMRALDGLLCRDEMIVGPLSVENDRDQDLIDAMWRRLKTARGSAARLKAEIISLSRRRGITSNTMGNYTRFPIAALKWTGWAESRKVGGIYGRSATFLSLTARGRQILEQVDRLSDVRAIDLANISDTAKQALVRAGFFQMLERAGFDIGEVHEETQRDLRRLADSLGTSAGLLFSPFQEMSLSYLTTVFPDVGGNGAVGKRTAVAEERSVGRSVLLSPITVSTSRVIPKADEEMREIFERAAKQAGGREAGVEALFRQYEGANRGVFYSLIVRLFRALGYNCELSRAGVNYQRYDAIILDEEHTIPIEIKSPGEEEYLSVKAVRQALENKVILLARRAFRTQVDTTSLAVGYHPPNDRSEVSALIQDIHRTYGISIGVMDFRTLLLLVNSSVMQGREHDRKELRHLRGIADVSHV